MFEFAEHFLHSAGAILLFVPDVPKIRTDVLSYANGYNFVLHQEWWGIKDLPSASFYNAINKVTIVSNQSLNSLLYFNFYMF